MRDIKSIVRSLVGKFNARDPFELCDYNKIEVLFKNLGTIRDMFHCCYHKKMIYLNKSLHSLIKRQVCTHELGHALLHRDINTIFWAKHTYFVTNKVEIEANVFAAELLIPDDDIRQYFGTGYCIGHIAKEIGVSESLVEYKIKESTANYLVYCEKLKSSQL